MNKWAWLGIGFGGGVIAGWFGHVLFLKRKSKAEEELIDIPEPPKQEEPKVKITVSDTLPEAKTVEDDISNLEKARTQLAEMAAKMNEMKKQYWHYPTEAEYEQEQIISHEAPKDDQKTPYVISEEEYLKGTYDQIDLGYYDEDDTLISWSSNTVVEEEDRARLLGDESVWMNFGELSDDPDMIHIRNPEQEIDFEIVCIHGSANLADPLEAALETYNDLDDLDIPGDDLEEEDE